MSRLDLQLKITLQSALHIGTGLGFARLVDERTITGLPVALSQATAPYTVSAPYIPASSLKGKLRQRFTEIADCLKIPVCPTSPKPCPHNPRCDAALLFGATNHEGVLRLTDAHLCEPYLSLSQQNNGRLQQHFLLGERHFVGISRGRRVARMQQLANIDEVAPGTCFELSGSAVFAPQAPPGSGGGPNAPVYSNVPVYINSTTGGPIPRPAALLVAAILNCTHLGGHAARGMGSVKVELAAQTVTLDGQTLGAQEILSDLLATIEDQ